MDLIGICDIMNARNLLFFPMYFGFFSILLCFCTAYLAGDVFLLACDVFSNPERYRELLCSPFDLHHDLLVGFRLDSNVPDLISSSPD